MHPQANRLRRRLRAFLPRGSAILWLGLAVLILLSLPLFALYASMSADCARLRAAVLAAQFAGAEPTVLEELLSLRAAAAEGETDETSAQRATTGGIAWPALLESIVSSAPAAVRLLAIEQHGAQIELRGVAGNEAALLDYEQHLRGSALFQSVGLQRGLVGAGTASFAVTLHLRGYQP